jgi:hypothetical protein
MKLRSISFSAAALAALIAAAAPAADRLNAGKAAGSSTSRPSVSLDSQALNAMLRADRDKDGTLTREELEHHDMTLAPRFSEADTDRDGKLTFYEFEKLVPPTESSAQRDPAQPAATPAAPLGATR